MTKRQFALCCEQLLGAVPGGQLRIQLIAGEEARVCVIDANKLQYRVLYRQRQANIKVWRRKTDCFFRWLNEFHWDYVGPLARFSRTFDTGPFLRVYNIAPLAWVSKPDYVLRDTGTAYSQFARGAMGSVLSVWRAIRHDGRGFDWKLELPLKQLSAGRGLAPNAASAKHAVEACYTSLLVASGLTELYTTESLTPAEVGPPGFRYLDFGEPAEAMAVAGAT